jgi:hypothetical protein
MTTHRKLRAYQRQIMYHLGLRAVRPGICRGGGWMAAAWHRGMRAHIRREAIATAVARSVLTAMRVIGSEEAP